MYVTKDYYNFKREIRVTITTKSGSKFQSMYFDPSKYSIPGFIRIQDKQSGKVYSIREEEIESWENEWDEFNVTAEYYDPQKSCDWKYDRYQGICFTR